MSEELFSASYSHEFLCNLLEPETCTTALHDLCTMVIAVEVSPAANSKVDKAFERLQRRHDVLRAQFVPTDSGLRRVRICPHILAKPQWHDIGDMEDGDLQVRILDLSRERWDIYKGPMVRLDVFKRQILGDVLVFRVCHAIVDGYGLANLFEDYIQLLAGVPIFRKPVSFKTYSEISARGALENLKEKRRYWEQLLFPTIPLPNFGRKSKGLALHGSLFDERNCGKVTRGLGADVTRRLEKYVRKTGITFFGHLGAAAQATFQEVSGDDGFYFTCLVGRHEASLKSFAGMHVNRLTGVCRAEYGDTLVEQGQALTKQFRQSIAHLPCRMSDPDGEFTKRILDEGGSSRQIRLHIPQVQGRMSEADSIWGALSHFGKNISIKEFTMLDRPALLNDFSILSTRSKTEQKLAFVYDEFVFGKDEVEQFADVFVRHVMSVI